MKRNLYPIPGSPGETLEVTPNITATAKALYERAMDDAGGDQLEAGANLMVALTLALVGVEEAAMPRIVMAMAENCRSAVTMAELGLDVRELLADPAGAADRVAAAYLAREAAATGAKGGN